MYTITVKRYESDQFPAVFKESSITRTAYFVKEMTAQGCIVTVREIVGQFDFVCRLHGSWEWTKVTAANEKAAAMRFVAESSHEPEEFMNVWVQEAEKFNDILAKPVQVRLYLDPIDACYHVTR